LRSNGRVRGLFITFWVTAKLLQSSAAPFHGIVDIIVLDSDNSVSEAFQKRCTALITRDLGIRGMRSAIDLNDELSLATNEVGNILADRYLPDEFEPTQLTIAQLSPEFRFCTSRIAA
jgi:hypothetical protein